MDQEESERRLAEVERTQEELRENIQESVRLIERAQVLLAKTRDKDNRESNDNQRD